MEQGMVMKEDFVKWEKEKIIDKSEKKTKRKVDRAENSLCLGKMTPFVYRME